METIPYSYMRRHLARIMDEVCDKKAPTVVTRRNAPSIVMMPLKEYRALEETLHLIRSPRNAERLLRSIGQAGPVKQDARRLSGPRGRVCGGGRKADHLLANKAESFDRQNQFKPLKSRATRAK
jgi:antitoxin YefM